jgi:N,N'-diacetyllegionaminate synthase
MNKVIIIAEAGVNHNGSLDIAKELVDVAAISGADAVKFQTFRAEDIVTKSANKAEYQIHNTGSNESQFLMLKNLELDIQAHKELVLHCKKKNIQFMSSPFDIKSINLLNKLSLNILKIPSGEITNLPYLRQIGKLKKKVILSTGMADLGEIEDALQVLSIAGTKMEDITVLHCHTNYPSLFKDVNLRAMLTIREAFKVRVGYSDHTCGIEACLAAVALGASVIEKHITLSREMDGPDHKASLEPQEFSRMVKCVRNIEEAMGDGLKKPTRLELKNILVARKSIVCSRKIKKGDLFTANNITTKRPGTGICPMLWDSIIGTRAKRGYEEDEIIEISEKDQW